MNNLEISLENCYGIGSFEKNFDFSQRNAHLIYAPNGCMKSSFAKVFEKKANGNNKDMPKDELYRERVAKCNIHIDGSPISSEAIYVADAERYDKIDSSAIFSRFLAKQELKERYDAIVTTLLKTKDEFLVKLKSISKSTDCEEEIEKTFKSGDKSSFFLSLLSIKNELEKPYKRFDFRYNTIFDKKDKVKAFVEKHKTLIQSYFGRYEELLKKSSFFHEIEGGVPFGIFQADTLLKAVEDEAFFKADHKITLSGNIEINDSEALKSLYKEEIQKILADEKLRKSFEVLSKAVHANADLRAFENLILEDKQLVPHLLDLEKFKKEYWLGVLVSEGEKSKLLIELYEKNQKEIQDIINEANSQRDQWEEIIRLYNNRFKVPFNVKLTNQADIILKQEAATLEFEFKDEEGKTISSSKNDLMRVLSRGEKRAFYILQLLFEVEGRKKENIDSLVIFDDIADSFDYKNKYAIVEYIKDLQEEPHIKSIILTHNFDFYRTIGSRLGLKSNSWMALKDAERKITLVKGQYFADAIQHISNQANQPKKFISLIPFARNLLEYSKGMESDEYKTLTSCLHIKDNTDSITCSMVFDILKEAFCKLEKKSIDFKDAKIKELVYNEADNIVENPDDEVLLENKIVLAIAIRLKTEDFFKKNHSDYFEEEVKGNQTNFLISKYSKDYPNEKIKSSHFVEVQLMTPELIHVNNFMYEPLIDMSIHHLVSLYKKSSDFYNE